MNQGSEQRAARQDLEKVAKIKLIAYQLWLLRRESNTLGDAERDYYQAERILESHKTLKLSLGSFGFWAVTFILGHSGEESCLKAINAIIEPNKTDEPEATCIIS